MTRNNGGYTRTGGRMAWRLIGKSLFLTKGNNVFFKRHLDVCLQKKMAGRISGGVDSKFFFPRESRKNKQNKNSKNPIKEKRVEEQTRV